MGKRRWRRDSARECPRHGRVCGNRIACIIIDNMVHRTVSSWLSTQPAPAHCDVDPSPWELTSADTTGSVNFVKNRKPSAYTGIHAGCDVTTQADPVQVLPRLCGLLGFACGVQSIPSIQRCQDRIAWVLRRVAY